MRQTHPLRSATLLVAVALGIAACADSPAGPDSAGLRPRVAQTGVTTTTVDDPTLKTDQEMFFRKTWVCKVGSAATFEVSINNGAAAVYTLADRECRLVYYWDHSDISIVDIVRITELPSPDFVLDSIARDSTHGEYLFHIATLTGTSTVEVPTTRSKAGIVTFYNSPAPPPPVARGCTPGYWKQSQHFDSWTAPYAPNTLFSAVFEDAFPGKTLLQVLGLGGGGLNALGRHTVAALLNSASAGVGSSFGAPADVIGAFNAVFPGTNYEPLKNTFEALNEQGCPLN